MPDHGRVPVEVEIHKEPTNEADLWSPPSARQVAAFLQERASHVETDDGWFVGAVVALDAIGVLTEFLASLPDGHPERAGVIRAIEVLRYEPR